MLSTNRADLLDSLRQQLRRITAADSATEQPPEPISTGIVALDDLLPHQGIPYGSIVEWLTPGPGAGAASLALAGVRDALARGGKWVVIDQRGDFFPVAAAGRGVPLERLLVLRPATARDAAWAFEQTLRCVGVSVAWHWLDKASERALRRWKVAAETGGGQGVLFRPLSAQRQTSWADVRWRIQPVNDCHEVARRLRVELAYCRGVLGRKQVELEYDDETGCVCLAPPLADSTPVARTARA